MQKTILYAVLNWGLGHATRSIPIIQYLLERKHNVIIVSDGDALRLLQDEFKSIECIQTVSYRAEYSQTGKTFKLYLAKQIPKFIHAINKEHQECLKLCKKYHVDYVISDNRYGFYHPQLPSALISHQLQLPYEENKWLEKIVNWRYQKYLQGFKELWVPDLSPPNSLSGKMSALAWSNVYYLGIDSRLNKQERDITYKSLSVISGPEPQRSKLEEKLLNLLPTLPGKHCLIRGRQNLAPIEAGEIEIIDLADKEKLEEKINACEFVVCRSGYTSLLDLIKLKKRAILIPTPGQIEQENLAKTMKEKGWFTVEQQDHLKLQLEANKDVPELPSGYNFEIIEQFLSS